MHNNAASSAWLRPARTGKLSLNPSSENTKAKKNRASNALKVVIKHFKPRHSSKAYSPSKMENKLSPSPAPKRHNAPAISKAGTAQTTDITKRFPDIEPFTKKEKLEWIEASIKDNRNNAAFEKLYKASDPKQKKTIATSIFLAQAISYVATADSKGYSELASKYLNRVMVTLAKSKNPNLTRRVLNNPIFKKVAHLAKPALINHLERADHNAAREAMAVEKNQNATPPAARKNQDANSKEPNSSAAKPSNNAAAQATTKPAGMAIPPRPNGPAPAAPQEHETPIPARPKGPAPAPPLSIPKKPSYPAPAPPTPEADYEPKPATRRSSLPPKVAEADYETEPTHVELDSIMLDLEPLDTEVPLRPKAELPKEPDHDEIYQVVRKDKRLPGEVKNAAAPAPPPPPAAPTPLPKGTASTGRQALMDAIKAGTTLRSTEEAKAKETARPKAAKAEESMAAALKAALKGRRASIYNGDNEDDTANTSQGAAPPLAPAPDYEFSEPDRVELDSIMRPPAPLPKDIPGTAATTETGIPAPPPPPPKDFLSTTAASTAAAKPKAKMQRPVQASTSALFDELKAAAAEHAQKSQENADSEDSSSVDSADTSRGGSRSSSPDASRFSAQEAAFNNKQANKMISRVQSTASEAPSEDGNGADEEDWDD